MVKKRTSKRGTFHLGSITYTVGSGRGKVRL